MTISKRIAALEAKAPPPKPNPKSLAALRALWDGLERDAVPDPVNYCKPSIYQLAAAMLERMASNALTHLDKQTLAGISECEYSATQLLEMTVEFAHPLRNRN